MCRKYLGSVQAEPREPNADDVRSGLQLGLDVVQREHGRQHARGGVRLLLGAPALRTRWQEGWSKVGGRIVEGWWRVGGRMVEGSWKVRGRLVGRTCALGGRCRESSDGVERKQEPAACVMYMIYKVNIIYKAPTESRGGKSLRHACVMYMIYKVNILYKAPTESRGCKSLRHV